MQVKEITETEKVTKYNELAFHCGTQFKFRRFGYA